MTADFLLAMGLLLAYGAAFILVPLAATALIFKVMPHG